MQRGPPFPEKFEYGKVPPRYNAIALNRRVPFYCLGWVFTEREFLHLYDPSKSFDDVLNLYGGRLACEWSSRFPDDKK
jgi:hypothetical protein